MNILLIRIGRMGDMVMILPAVYEIMRRYPNAQLYAITSADGLRLLPLVGIPAERILLYRNGVIYRAIDNRRARRFIAAVSFDQVFCFRTPKAHINFLPAHTHMLADENHIVHYATRCLRLIDTTLKPQVFTKGNTYLPISNEKRERITCLLQAQGVTPKTVLIGLHPGFSGLQKWWRRELRHRVWPKTSFAQLAIQLAAMGRACQIDIKIVMNVLPEEEKWANDIVALSAGQIVLLPLPADFQLYLAYLKRLNVLIVTNTGVMHLAAALTTPVVALFSAMHPEDCGPYVDPDLARILRAEDTLHPELGLASLSVDKVLAATRQILGW